MNYTIEELMRAWEAAGEAMWCEVRVERRHRSNGNAREVVGIRDTQSGYVGDIERIGSLFARAAPWALRLMGGTYDEKHDASAWCGHTQSNWGLSVGDHLEPGRCVGVYLDPDIAYNCLASTRRMTSAKKWRAAGHDLLVPINVVQLIIGIGTSNAGDLAKVLAIPRVCTIVTRHYGDKRDDVGGHFVLVTDYDPVSQTIETLEANAYGLLGNGEYGEGVIKRVGLEGEKWDARPVEDLRLIYPFDVHHFEEMGRP